LQIGLNRLFEYYKNVEHFQVISGMDANHFIESLNLTRPVTIVPSNPDHSTSIKKRSYIQAQLKKADVAINEVKDHIVTTLKVSNHWRALVNAEEANNLLLPNDQHPYDHLIVAAVLVLTL
jgi:sugar diacid utilization regulator